MSMTTKAEGVPPSRSAPQKRRQVEARRRASQHRAHHWLIGTPNGPTSAGRCRICGAQREFANSSEDTAWGGAIGLFAR
jgi:hypothetical protein